jgi:hypothetical protein
MLVMGNAARLATPDELEQMKALLRTALEDGGVGLSTGLTYVPAMYSDTDELVALCEVVAEYGGFYCPHHRNYGTDALGGYAECFEIARRSGVALHLAHTHLSFEANKGKLPQLLKMFDDAIAGGVDLSFDAYPYLAGMTTLLSQLPSWALSGSGDEQMGALRDPETRKRIIEALDVIGSDGHQGLTVNWSSVYLAGLPRCAGDGMDDGGQPRRRGAEAQHLAGRTRPRRADRHRTRRALRVLHRHRGACPHPDAARGTHRGQRRYPRGVTARIRAPGALSRACSRPMCARRRC